MSTLIDTLLREVDDSRKLTIRQRTSFRAAVKNFTQENTSVSRQGIENIYVIIRGWWEYYDKGNPHDGTVTKLPYSGKFTDKGVEFDYEKFPETLKRILCLFITKHRDFMNCSITRQDPTAENES